MKEGIVDLSSEGKVEVNQETGEGRNFRQWEWQAQRSCAGREQITFERLRGGSMWSGPWGREREREEWSLGGKWGLNLSAFAATGKCLLFPKEQLILSSNYQDPFSFWRGFSPVL